MFETCTEAVFTLIPSSSAIRAFGQPAATRAGPPARGREVERRERVAGRDPGPGPPPGRARRGQPREALHAGEQRPGAERGERAGGVAERSRSPRGRRPPRAGPPRAVSPVGREVRPLDRLHAAIARCHAAARPAGSRSIRPRSASNWATSAVARSPHGPRASVASVRRRPRSRDPPLRELGGRLVARPRASRQRSISAWRASTPSHASDDVRPAPPATAASARSPSGRTSAGTCGRARAPRATSSDATSPAAASTVPARPAGRAGPGSSRRVPAPPLGGAPR
jgi:hypothetical protein